MEEGAGKGDHALGKREAKEWPPTALRWTCRGRQKHEGDEALEAGGEEFGLGPLRGTWSAASHTFQGCDP